MSDELSGVMHRLEIAVGSYVDAVGCKRPIKAIVMLPAVLLAVAVVVLW